MGFVCRFAKEPGGGKECLEALWSIFESCAECEVECYRRGWDAGRAAGDNEGLVRLTWLEKDLHFEYEALPEGRPDVLTRLHLAFVRLEDLLNRTSEIGIYNENDPQLDRQEKIIEGLQFVRGFYYQRTQRYIDYDLVPPGQCYKGSRREGVRALLEEIC